MRVIGLILIGVIIAVAGYGAAIWQGWVDAPWASGGNPSITETPPKDCDNGELQTPICGEGLVTVRIYKRGEVHAVHHVQPGTIVLPSLVIDVMLGYDLPVDLIGWEISGYNGLVTMDNFDTGLFVFGQDATINTIMDDTILFVLGGELTWGNYTETHLITRPTAINITDTWGDGIDAELGTFTSGTIIMSVSSWDSWTTYTVYHNGVEIWSMDASGGSLRLIGRSL